MFRWSRRSRSKGRSDVTIHVPQIVLERIRATLSNSPIEEGGKYVGLAQVQPHGVDLFVDDYIDSGPNASKSATHIIPNGEYQEALFRVLEIYKPEIDHIGSWHSHHCNGYPTLSNGDVDGYVETVNSRNYNSRFFLASLVTEIRRDQMIVRHFVFEKGVADYFEVPPDRVIITKSESEIGAFLRVAESCSHGTGQVSRDAAETDFPLALHSMIRDDGRWILKRFPDARALRHRSSGMNLWEWSLSGPHRSTLRVRCSYDITGSSPLLHVSVEVGQGLRIVRKDVPWDEDRETVILNLIDTVMSTELAKTGGAQ